LLGVIGAAQATSRGLAMAEEVGRAIARAGAVLVCGGLGGVMEAAARGAYEAGGEVLGILPGSDRSAANRYVTLPVVTAMGHARNVIIAQTAEALIAVEGELGTLSEAAIGLKLERPLIVLPGPSLLDRAVLKGAVKAESAQSAVAMALQRINP
jgi:uncharacterized protein (TIGR00725 family)